jgi:hypothetical protein
MEMSKLDWITTVLVIIGAINWGLVGVAGIDLVQLLSVGWLISLVYILVGLSGLWMLYKVIKGE